MLEHLPENTERAHQELDLQIPLGIALSAIKGWSAPEVGYAFERAKTLCEQLGVDDTFQLFSVTRGLWEYYELTGELRTARSLAEQLLGIGHQSADPLLLLTAHNVMGDISFWLGEFATAKIELEKARMLYAPQLHHAPSLLYSAYDPGLACLSWEILVFWLMGYPRQALQQQEQTLALSHELGHPFSLALLLFFTVYPYQSGHEPQKTQTWCEALIALCQKENFPNHEGFGKIQLGWALVMQGQEEKGIASMQEGVAICQSIEAKGWLTYTLTLFAEVYLQLGQIHAGLDACRKALDVVDETGEAFQEAELHRLNGELLLLTGSDEAKREAEKSYRRAIEVARRQQAKMWELRATICLAQLWQKQGKIVEAHQMLAEIYDWFTEDFHTADSKEAKALLEELSAYGNSH